MTDPKIVKFPTSHRGIPLMDVPNPAGAVLTVENYCKWYEFHLLYPNGEVERVVPEEGIEFVQSTYGIGAWCDHNYHPAVLEAQAAIMGVLYSQQGYELLLGRWYLEQELLAKANTPKWATDDFEDLVHAGLETVETKE